MFFQIQANLQRLIRISKEGKACKKLNLEIELHCSPIQLRPWPLYQPGQTWHTIKGLAFNIPGKRDEYWIGDYLVSLVSRTRLSSLCLQLHTIGVYTLYVPLNTTTWCTYLSILLLQIVDNCTECGSALRSTRVTQDRGRWIRPTSQHGRPLLLNALHFHQQYPHLDLDLQGVPKKSRLKSKWEAGPF